MIPTIASSERKGSLLSRYAQRMGALVDRRTMRRAHALVAHAEAIARRERVRG